MITAEGYSKDPNIKPEGIVITWSKALIDQHNGLLPFIRRFETVMSNENNIWINKCIHVPKHDDLLYVYIIIANQVRYRLYYGGHYKNPVNTFFSPELHSWSYSNAIGWPHIKLGGPFKKATVKIHRPGFQGYRYCTKLF